MKGAGAYCEDHDGIEEDEKASSQLERSAEEIRMGVRAARGSIARRG